MICRNGVAFWLTSFPRWKQKANIIALAVRCRVSCKLVQSYLRIGAGFLVNWCRVSCKDTYKVFCELVVGHCNAVIASLLMPPILAGRMRECGQIVLEQARLQPCEAIAQNRVSNSPS